MDASSESGGAWIVLESGVGVVAGGVVAGGAAAPAAVHAPGRSSTGTGAVDSVPNKGASASNSGLSGSVRPILFLAVQPGPCTTRMIGSVPLIARINPSRFFAVRISQSKNKVASDHSTIVSAFLLSIRGSYLSKGSLNPGNVTVRTWA